MIINHEELLIKYIRHIGDCEGINYITRCNCKHATVVFTDEEVLELKKLSSHGWMYRFTSYGEEEE